MTSRTARQLRRRGQKHYHSATPHAIKSTRLRCEEGGTHGDRLEVLATLVEVYEATHHRIEPPDPIEAILYHLESRGLAQRVLEPCIGSRARVSEILNRRRHLTIDMIRRLHKTLGIPAEVLIRPYRLRRSAA